MICIYTIDIGMEFDIEKFPMHIRKHGKRDINKTNITTKSRNNLKHALRKQKGKVLPLMNTGSGYYQISGAERKNKKRVPQRNEKIPRNQTLRKKSHQRYKYLSSPPCKIFQIREETSLKIRTVIMIHKSLHLKDDRLNESEKEREDECLTFKIT